MVAINNYWIYMTPICIFSFERTSKNSIIIICIFKSKRRQKKKTKAKITTKTKTYFIRKPKRHLLK